MAASQVPATREAAMQYWLFGANTPQQLCLRYGAAAAALVVVQWFIHSFLLGGDNPRAADAMMFGTLSLSAVIRYRSVPGRTCRWTSASSALSVRTGSTTIIERLG